MTFDIINYALKAAFDCNTEWDLVDRPEGIGMYHHTTL